MHTKVDPQLAEVLVIPKQTIHIKNVQYQQNNAWKCIHPIKRVSYYVARVYLLLL